MTIIILEPDRIIARLLKQKIVDKNVVCNIASTPDEAMLLIDKQIPDAIITELSLSNHSALEFLYEMRTYVDVQYTPVYIYSSVLLDSSVLESSDWGLLKIAEYFYKPHTDIDTVVECVASLVEA